MKPIITFLWNPINVVEGEGKWMATVLVLVLCCWFVTSCFHMLIRRVQKYPQAVGLRYALESLYIPGVSLLWFGAGLFSLDVVTEHWFSVEWATLFVSLIKIASGLAFGWFLFRYKKQMIAHLIEKKQHEEPESKEVLLACSKIFSVLIVIIIVFLLHDTLGLSMATALTFGGVGGLAVAFASQEIVQNFFGGFMLHMTRPFFHGETVIVPQTNLEGVVEKIGWYQTLVRSNDRYALYVPNALFTRASVLNKSRINGRLIDLSFYLDVPQSELFASFCMKMEEELLSLKEAIAHGTRVVWIEELYDKKARLRLQVLVVPLSLSKTRHLQTHILLLAQTVAKSLGGTLSSSPSLVS